jgi:hypothetical protein
MTRAALAVPAALLFLSSALPAAAAGEDPAAPPKPHVVVYRGEAVVHALDGTSLMIALDEAGEGRVTRTFLVSTDEPLPTGLDLRSRDATIESRKDRYYVALPREHRLLVFTMAGESSRPSAPEPAWSGLEITRIGGVNAWGNGRGAVKHLPLTLDDVEAGRLPPPKAGGFGSGRP